MIALLSQYLLNLTNAESKANPNTNLMIRRAGLSKKVTMRIMRRSVLGSVTLLAHGVCDITCTRCLTDRGQY